MSRGTFQVSSLAVATATSSPNPPWTIVEDGFYPCAETEDEDHLDSFSLGEVFASSGIRRKQANGMVHEVDWALFEFADGRLPEDNSIPMLWRRR